MWVGPGLGPGHGGEYEQLYQHQIWRINTWATAQGRSVAQGVGAAGPETNGLVRSNQKPGQIDFGRLLVVGNAVTILKSVRRRQTIAHRRRRSLPVHQIYMCSNTSLSAVYRASTQAEAYGIRRRRPRELARELDKARRVVLITEPEGRAWQATDRLLADRCRGAPRNPKAPVMLAKPQIRTQIMTAPGRPGRPSRQLSSQPRLDTVRHLAPRPRRAWQPGSHLSVPLSPVLAPASLHLQHSLAPAYYLQAAHAADYPPTLDLLLLKTNQAHTLRERHKV
ncbi:hypothetical protein LA080_002740 [Diaporthe eres]|nr:hypothetical protein LA080_002740 [Diaporthe eres]